MLDAKSQKFYDILFNANVRSATRESVLLACLKRLNIDEAIFLKTLCEESQNSKNVIDERRERDRSAEEFDLKAREMRFMRGD
jgi:hypothetical protein